MIGMAEAHSGQKAGEQTGHSEMEQGACDMWAGGDLGQDMRHGRVCGCFILFFVCVCARRGLGVFSQ